MSSLGREERKAEFLQNLEEDLKNLGKKSRKKKLGVNLYQSCVGMEDDDESVIQPLNDSHLFPDLRLVIKTIVWYVC